MKIAKLKIVNYLKTILILVSLIVLLGFLVFTHTPTIHAAGNTYYVSTAGNDSNPGTQTQPWRTIGKANATLVAGDTVYIKSGTYNETIKPANSGSAGNYITYASYPGETATISNVYNGVDLNGKHHVVIDRFSITDVGNAWVVMDSGNPSYNIIRNNTMRRARGWAGIKVIGASYIKIQNNTLTGDCFNNADYPGDSIDLHGSIYSLIEGNHIEYARHIAVSMETTGHGPAHHNIIRNNTIRNPWHSNFSSYGNIDDSIIEGNTILDAGSDAGPASCAFYKSWPREDHASIQFASSRNIIRHNVLTGNGRFQFNEFSGFTAADNRVYNNTSYKDYRGLWLYAGSSNVIKNNIASEDIIYGFQGLTNNILTYNNAYLTALNCNGANCLNNLSQDPMFVDKTNRDFHLQSASPMIDAGDFLTRIVSPSGSGSSVVVQDAKYFFDGYGIVTGDTIQVGTQTAVITAINYSTNTLTLNKSVSWTVNQGISLPYNGSKPDIGVYEYGGVTITPTPTPTSTPTPSTNPAPSACDLNKDNSTNVLDLQYLANVILGISSCSSGLCDLNKDSQVNVLDLQYLANVILGKSSCQ